MASLEVHLSLNGDDYRKVKREIEDALFFKIYEDFYNLEATLNLTGVSYENEEE